MTLWWCMEELTVVSAVQHVWPSFGSCQLQLKSSEVEDLNQMPTESAANPSFDPQHLKPKVLS